MKDQRTNKLLESVRSGSNLGFIHQGEKEYLIYLSYGYIMGAKVWRLIIDDTSTDYWEDEKIELGRTSKKVTESDAKAIATNVLKDKGIDQDMTKYEFNFDGTL